MNGVECNMFVDKCCIVTIKSLSQYLLSLDSKSRPTWQNVLQSSYNETLFKVDYCTIAQKGLVIVINEKSNNQW